MHLHLHMRMVFVKQTQQITVFTEALREFYFIPGARVLALSQAHCSSQVLSELSLYFIV